MADLTRARKSIKDNIIDNSKGLITAEKMRETLNTMLDDTESSMSELNNEIGSATGDVNVLKPKVEQNTKDIEELKTELNSVDKIVESLQDDIYEHDEAIKGIQGQTVVRNVRRDGDKISDFIEVTSNTIGEGTDNMQTTNIRFKTINGQHIMMFSDYDSDNIEISGGGGGGADLSNLNIQNGSGTNSIYQKGNSSPFAQYASVFGNGNIAYNYSEQVVGHYSKPTGNLGDGYGWYGDSIHNVFSIGNGEDGKNEHNAFEVRQDGSVYISDTTAGGNYYEKPMLNLQETIKELKENGGGSGAGDSYFEKEDNYVRQKENNINFAIGQAMTFESGSSNSFIQGNNCTTDKAFSHAQGWTTHATGTASHAEGDDSHAEGNCTHAEGKSTYAISEASHAEGKESKSQGDYSHAEGENTQTTNICAHSEGKDTIAGGAWSHAEGELTKTEGHWSHAEGKCTHTVGQWSHAEGGYTKTHNDFEYAQGIGNISTEGRDEYSTLFSIGNGYIESANVTEIEEDKRHNAFEVKKNGEIFISDINGEGNYWEKPMISLQEALSSATGGGGGTGPTDKWVKSVMQEGGYIRVANSSGTVDEINFKTINGQSIFGTSDIKIGGGDSLFERGNGENAVQMVGCSANGEATFAAGRNARTQGMGAFAACQSSALSDFTSSFGLNNSASGYASSVFGEGNETYGKYEFVIGSHAINTNYSELEWTGSAEVSVFKIGNGNWDRDHHNAVDIRQNGDFYFADTNADGDYDKKPMLKLQDVVHKKWVGTEYEYLSLEDYDPDVFYYIIEEE